jgi:lipopolysaccharide export system permease protein
MRILDVYLLRTFALPWLSCLLGFTFLFVMVDLVEELNTFVDAGIPFWGVLLYYVRFLPSIWSYVGPITMLLGLLYALYQLTRNNEVIAMRASGISLYRVLFPFLVFGVFVSVFSMYLSRTVAPRSQAWISEYMLRMSEPDADIKRNIRYKHPETQRSWNIHEMNLATSTFQGVTVMQKRSDVGTLEYVLNAETATWQDPYWYFQTVELQRYSEEGLKQGPIEERDSMLRQDLTETPEQILRETKDLGHLTSRELNLFLRDRPTTISDRSKARIRTELHIRNAHPWLCLVTMLMAAPFGTQTARKGVFRGVILCLTFFFSLYFIMTLFKALGLGMTVTPWVAGWTPTLVFGLLGGIMVRKLR